MNIFNSLGSNYNWFFIIDILRGGRGVRYSLALKAYLEDKYQGQAVLVYKGREAIELSLRLLNLPKNSFIAINGFTCYAVYQAIIKVGHEVEYLDIEESDLNFSPVSLESSLKNNPRIKVLIVQNTLGYPCDIDKIAQICQKNNIVLIEDLAHSIGAVYKNNMEAGTVGDFTILSFSQDKMIDGISGGALVIRNKKYQNINLPELNEIPFSRQLRDKLYPFLTLMIRTTYQIGLGRLIHAGLKKINLLSRPMDNLESEKPHNLASWYCRLIRRQFGDLQKNLGHRREIASIYVKHINPVILLRSNAEKAALSANLRFPILANNRDSLIQYLKAAGIHVSDVWYDAPIAPKKYLELTNYRDQCPESEKVCRQILNLPTHQGVSAEKAREISATINQWIKSQ